MKITHDVQGGRARIALLGDLEAESCNCLQAFWDTHVSENLQSLDIEMEDVDAIDGPTVALLVDLVRLHLADATEVTLHHPPQMLAHTLYKIGLLDHAALTLVAPRRDEQPYT